MHSFTAVLLCYQVREYGTSSALRLRSAEAEEGWTLRLERAELEKQQLQERADLLLDQVR